VHKGNYRLPHVLVGLEKAVVDAELAAAVADDDRAVGREPHTVLRAKAESLQSRPELLGISRRRLVQLERELFATT
jgi:hypothetical protein